MGKRKVKAGAIVCLGTCDKCGKQENINLLDSKDDGSGDFTILECIACYGSLWQPCGSAFEESIRPELTKMYLNWWCAG